MQEFLELLRNIIPVLLQGVVVTLQIAAVSLLLGVATGLPIGIGRVYGPPWLQRLLGAYVTLFQGTPLLIQLFLVYYGLPDLGITFGRLTAAYITLGLNSGAYQAEYLRGALQSVSEGQMTAARAIGMSKWQAIRSIILPQALRLVLPAWSNEVSRTMMERTIIENPVLLYRNENGDAVAIAVRREGEFCPRHAIEAEPLFVHFVGHRMRAEPEAAQ